MSRIIKLTESQLRDVVQKVINEQSTGTAQQIWNSLSIAQAGMGGAGGTDEKKLISAISQINSIDLYTQVVQLMRTKTIGNYNSIVKLLQGELEGDNLKEFKQIQALLKKIGVTLTAQTRKGNQAMGKGGATYTYDELIPSSIRQVVGPAKPVITPPKPEDQNKPTYRTCTGFPIKYGCKQTEVGRLQQCLGLRVDYSFGPATLKAFLDLNPDPNARGPVQKQIIEIGLSEGAYKRVTAKCASKPKPKTKQPAPKPGEAPVVDTRTKTDIAPLKARQIQQIPVNVDIPKLQAIPTPGIDPTRKAAILGQIKDRGFDKVYKGQALTPEEKSWLSSQMGTDPNKDKMKAGGEEEKLRFSNT